MNLAILGTGGIADGRLAPAIRIADGVQLWSVLSRSADRAAAFAKAHRARAPEPAHTDLAVLLGDPQLDGVVIATPDKLHAHQTIAAARAGKHVLVEKPMATSAEEGEAMVRACEDAGVKLAVAYHLRWHQGHRRLEDRIRAGALGNLRHMRAQWAWPAPDASNWRAHSNVGRWWSLAGVGTHLLDLIRWFMVPRCGEVQVVRSVVNRSVWRTPHDETAVVALQFEDGATAEFCSSVLFESPNRVEVYGSEGWAVGNNTLGPLGRGSVRTNRGPLRFTAVDPYLGEIHDFAAAVRQDRRPEVDGGEGLRNVELLLRISEAGSD